MYVCPSDIPINSEVYVARAKAYAEKAVKKINLEASITQIQSDPGNENIRHDLYSQFQKKYGLDLDEFAYTPGMIRGYEFRIAELRQEIKDIYVHLFPFSS